MIYDETPKCEAAEIQSWFKCTGKYNFNIYLKRRRRMFPLEVRHPYSRPTYLNSFLSAILFKNNVHSAGFTLGQTLHKTKHSLFAVKMTIMTSTVHTKSYTRQWGETMSESWERLFKTTKITACSERKQIQPKKKMFNIRY